MKGLLGAHPAFIARDKRKPLLEKRVKLEKQSVVFGLDLRHEFVTRLLNWRTMEGVSVQREAKLGQDELDEALC